MTGPESDTLRIPCTLMRGGTSRGLVFRREDLPPDKSLWDPIFLAALGSPDVRQLDGVGAGDSHTSKIAIVNPASPPPAAASHGDAGDAADMEYLFGEVAITEPRVDYAGNSGNIISALGLFAVEEGWAGSAADLLGQSEVRVRVRNLNTGKIAEITVPLDRGRPAEEGDFSIAGVPGRAPRIEMVFPRPEGSVTGLLLPTGEARTRLNLPGVGELETTLLDAANPVVLARGEDLGLTPAVTPAQLNADKETLARIEQLRAAASAAMGLVERAEQALAHSNMIPFPVLLFPPSDYPCFTPPHDTVAAEEMDLCARVISLGMGHKSINVTVTVALTAAAVTPGTLAHELSAGRAENGEFRIGHPSGVMHTRNAAGADARGRTLIEWVSMGRTARRIMEGSVLVQPHKLRWIQEIMKA